MLVISILSFVFLAIGIVAGFFCWRYKKKILPVGLCLISGLIAALVIFLSLAVNKNFVFLIFGAIFIFTITLWFALEVDEGIQKVMHFVISCAIALLIILLLAVVDGILEKPEHVIYLQYTIELDEDSYSIKYDSENVSDEVHGYIQDKIADMKEYGKDLYEGFLKIKYSCQYPLCGNHDKICTCTTKKICSTCKEYLGACIVDG